MWNFFVGLFQKKEVVSDQNLAKKEAEYTVGEAHAAPKETDPWQFLKDIAKKIFGFKKEVQQDILNYGRKLKAAGVSFVLMIDTSPGLPKSPAKEKAKKEKQGQSIQQ